MSPVRLVDLIWSSFESCRGYATAEFARNRLQPKENELFYQGNLFGSVSPVTQHILRHIREVGFLRPPQVDAFELYVYLKEVQGNPTISELYRRFFPSGTPSRPQGPNLWSEEVEELSYPNWLFALGMGTGKTILMATMIAYDFILAEHYPEDRRFASNALVFAPDTTIVDSLREIRNFDYSRVIPDQYGLFLSTNLKFHYLSSLESELALLPGSAYNIIVSNIQKIMVKRYTTGRDQKTVFPVTKHIEGEWRINNRLRQLEGLDRLAVFVDEAHHSFGTTMVGDLKRARETINRLNRKSPLAGCVNLTGTPYVNGKMLPQVVFHYPVKQAIEDGHLKQVKFIDYASTKTDAFIRDVVDRFWSEYGERRREGLLPKIAFYCTTISELESEFRPSLEKILIEKGIPITRILVNHSQVGEENIRRFRLLDTPESEDQFILLVSKGTEGWNCRSLFATAMYRQPRSRIFLLQSALRCLRAIGDMPQTASVYLSSENRAILEDELRKNFGATTHELERYRNVAKAPSSRPEQTEIIAARRREHLRWQYRKNRGPLHFNLAEYYLKHKAEFTGQVAERTLVAEDGHLKLVTGHRQSLKQAQKKYTLYSLVEEISRHTHLPCLEVEELLRESDAGIRGCLAWVNKENRLLEVIIGRILEGVFCYETTEETAQIKSKPGR